MTVAGLGVMLCMAVFFVRYFIKHVREDSARDIRLKS